MTNKIGPVDSASIAKTANKPETTSSNRSVSGEAGRADGASGRVSTTDTVELTSNGQLLERLEKSLASVPDVDAARVAEVKAAIRNGDYEVDAGAIAESLIRFERGLGSSK